MNFLQNNIDISNLSWFKTRAFTKYYFEINSIDDLSLLKDLIKFSKDNNLKILFVWWWTNLLFSFDLFNWIVIKNNLKWFNYDIDKKILEVYSSEKIWEIREKLEKDFWQNIWHRFIWLPWSIWWAVFWNAGCFGLEVENNFLSCEVYNLDNNKIEILDKQKVNFSYRNSLFKETWKYFIIKVKFDLSKIVEKYSCDIDNIKFREEVQPKWNSAWSFFKNPSKDISAWYLLEQVWLKWFSYKNAYFSDKHANFLMTKNDFWDYRDLIFLIEKARKLVLKKYNINLENEVRIVNN